MVTNKTINIALIDDNPQNYNEHPPEQIAELQSSLRDFGQVQTVVVYPVGERYMAIAGHGVLIAMRKEKFTTVDCRVIPADWPEEKAWAYIVADNEHAKGSKVNMVQLGSLMREIKDRDPELLKSTGVKAVDMKILLNVEKGVDAEPRIDRGDELAVDWGVEEGQVWQVGPHRLSCWDATDGEFIRQRLFLPGELADLVATDPPYGVNYTGHRVLREEIVGDEIDDEKTRLFVADYLRAIPLRPGASYYVCSPGGGTETAFRLALIDAGMPVKQALVWAKQHFVRGRQDYHWMHETILYGWKTGAAHYFIDDRKQTTLWYFDRYMSSKDHPTMKPVGMFDRMLLNSSVPGQIVYDGCLGSGTTLISAERTGRICRASEIKPAYVAVTLQRYFEATGVRGILVKE